MNILVLDDEQTIEAVALGLTMQSQAVTVLGATDGDAGLRAFYAHDPDLVVLSLALEGVDGFRVLQEIRSLSDVPTIVLSHRGDAIEELRALELGADTYLERPVRHLLLLARIRAALRRAELPPTLRNVAGISDGGLVVDFLNQRVTLHDQRVTLTPTEYRLLAYLLRHAGRTLPHRALVCHVWGPDFGATTNHLRVYITRLRGKVECDPRRPQRILTVPGAGYRFEQPTSWTFVTSGGGIAAHASR
jgi:two-component system KDP operon response regulator KdpE